MEFRGQTDNQWRCNGDNGFLAEMRTRATGLSIVEEICYAWSERHERELMR